MVCSLRNVSALLPARVSYAVTRISERAVAEIYFSDSPVTPFLESILFETISLPGCSYALSLSLFLALCRDLLAVLNSQLRSPVFSNRPRVAT